jgi:predicted nucleotidyltransferase
MAIIIWSFMIKNNTIEEVRNRLIKTYNPLEIYLFGSYAWGQPDEQSDLDILIVVEKSQLNAVDRLYPGYQALLDLDIPNDILVYTKEEFEQRSHDITTLGYKIKNSGRRIYAKS